MLRKPAPAPESVLQYLLNFLELFIQTRVSRKLFRRNICNESKVFNTVSWHFILAAGIAVAQQPAPPPPSPPDEPFEQNFSFFLDGGGFWCLRRKERVAARTLGRYNLNQVRGVGVTRVIKDSPARKPVAQRRRHLAHRRRKR